MAEIAKGDKVIGKNGEEGEILSFDDRYVTTQFQGKITNFLRDAFDKGCLIHQKTLDEMSLVELYQFGCGFYEKKDDDNAIRYITLAAERGSAMAMLHLAQSYEEGDGVEQDEDKAIEWYKRAAAAGDYEAMSYLHDEICLDYDQEPLEWCIKVAEQGDDNVQSYLSKLYFDGNRVEKDFSESLKWKKRAAEGGNRDAIYDLGLMYYYGDGVEQNYEKAYYWFDKDAACFSYMPSYICADLHFYVTKLYKNAFHLYLEAAKAGVDDAVYKIGEMYYYGLGVEQDYKEAFEALTYNTGLENGEFDEDCINFIPSKALSLLAEMYQNGLGVEKDLKVAEKLFRAAEKAEKLAAENH